MHNLVSSRLDEPRTRFDVLLRKRRSTRTATCCSALHVATRGVRSYATGLAGLLTAELVRGDEEEVLVRVTFAGRALRCQVGMVPAPLLAPDELIMLPERFRRLRHVLTQDPALTAPHP